MNLWTDLKTKSLQLFENGLSIILDNDPNRMFRLVYDTLRFIYLILLSLKYVIIIGDYSYKAFVVDQEINLMLVCMTELWRQLNSNDRYF